MAAKQVVAMMHLQAISSLRTTMNHVMNRHSRIIFIVSFAIILGLTLNAYMDSLASSSSFFNIIDGGDLQRIKLDSFLQENDKVIQLTISVCQENHIRGQGYPENDRQFRQIKVLLKSVAVLARTRVKYNIITDSHDVYQQIVNSTADWSPRYRNKIVFALRKDLYNPPDMGQMRNLYRPCASQRMFLPDSFPDTDAMIYTDTDALFMQPPELLWDLFQNFDERQVIGVTAHLYQYTPPFNAENAKYAYELPCEWNYMFIFCNYVRNTCPSFYSNGVALLHGVDWSFINEKGPKFKAVFFAFEKYDMKSPVEDLLKSMENHMKEAPLHACGKIPNIDELVLKGIRRHLP